MQFQTIQSIGTSIRDPYYDVHYARYGPKYSHTNAYLNPGVYGAGALLANEKPSYGDYNALLAPLCAGMVSGIDFSKSYLDKNLDPVAGLFTQKTFFGKARIEDLLADMSVRYDMMNRNLTALDYQICYLDSEIMQLPPFQIGISKDLDRIKTALEAKIIDLESEKMKNRIDSWRDICKAKSDLMECLGEYAAAQGSKAFLDTTQGGQNY